MPIALSDLRIVIYWVLWFGLQIVTRALYSGYRQYEKWEIDEAYPQYARILKRYPLLNAAVSLLLVGGMLAVVADAGGGKDLIAHSVGLIYGVLLVVDAGFSWVTGIRPLPERVQPRYIIEEERTWRSKLQLGIAGVYLAVPAILLLNKIG